MTKNNNTKKESEYPAYLLEGDIVSIDPSTKIIVLNAKISKINSNLQDAERTINTEDAEIIFYNIDTGKEESAKIADLNIGDNILVATKELNYDETETRLEYTAIKIRKMVN